MSIRTLGFGLSLLALSMGAMANAPVVDESQNFTTPSPPQSNFIEEEEFMPVHVARNETQTIMPQDQAQIEDQASELSEQGENVLLNKMQSLQQELAQLRGQLEVQTHDLKMMQQQQQTLYQDLDQRLANLSQGGEATAQVSKPQAKSAAPDAIMDLDAVQSAAKPAATAPSPVKASPVNIADEQARYAAAYEKVRNRDFEGATHAMKTFLTQYPQSAFAANAHYWLGELYLVKREPEQAMQEFNTVIKDFPNSTKNSAALLKLGFIYADEGESAKAKAVLKKVVEQYPDTTMANLAKSRLSNLK